MSGYDADYFDALYASDPDPWRFETSDYERAKYDATLAAIDAVVLSKNDIRAVEIGCSIGVLTRLLAMRCADLLAVDISQTALTRARARCADLGHVRFAHMRIPKDWPRGRADLIVFSEVLYFMEEKEIGLSAEHALAMVSSGGVIVLVNYLGPTDGPISGDHAAAIFIRNCAGRVAIIRQQRTDRYRLDVVRGVP